MSKRKFRGVQFVETVRVGKRTYAFGIYGDHKVGRIPFAGLSERNPEDRENSTRGRNLAIARAFETLGKQIEKREWAKIKNSTKATTNGKTLTPKEIAALKEAGAAIREARASKRKTKDAKEDTKTSKSAIKTSTKSS
jgi:hypothetical protein